jgi:hypothetical protein
VLLKVTDVWGVGCSADTGYVECPVATQSEPMPMCGMMHDLPDGVEMAASVFRKCTDTIPFTTLLLAGWAVSSQ